MNHDLLHTALLASVPLMVHEIVAAGLTEAQRHAEAHQLSQTIGEKGDVILFKSKKKGETADSFNALARGIALLSFNPGGVRAFGHHFQTVEGKLTVKAL